jgi:hypothetical protein
MLTDKDIEYAVKVIVATWLQPMEDEATPEMLRDVMAISTMYTDLKDNHGFMESAIKARIQWLQRFLESKEVAIAGSALVAETG